jgi:SAM-dependent methyltransferase
LISPRIFDAEHYARLNSSREEALSAVLKKLVPQLNLRTAIDVGCGAGYFSKFLRSTGFEITAVDGRAENVEETKRRVPDAKVATVNAEDSRISELGKFDLVFCFGLLYHLENPFQTIRSLYQMTGRLLLVEGVTFPGNDVLMGLVDEGRGEDQGLNFVAFYPTEACLIKMMYRAGFTNVYKFREMPRHPDFRPQGKARRVRTMLAASSVDLPEELLEKVPEPRMAIQPWIGAAEGKGILRRAYRFASKPLPDKIGIAKRLVGLPAKDPGKKS